MQNIPIGSQFGNWIVERKLGHGGNGVVWRVHETGNRIGAMKFLSPWMDDDGVYYFDRKRYARFRDETVAFSECQDIEGVLPLFDYYLPATEKPSVDDPPWLVLAFAIPLETALGDEYSLVDAVSACASIARTLTIMHLRGFSHRDVKPDNLFRYDDKWCLGDFGLASFQGKSAETSTGETLGPRFYIADEMLNNAPNADGTLADVYSLAKTLWKLGTKQAYPLQGMISANEASMRLSTYNDDARAFKLDPLIEHATRHNPELRIPMSTFADELMAWLKPASTLHRSDQLSLNHLAPRVERLRGNFEQEKKYVEQNNAKVQLKVRMFLDAFNPTLARLMDSLQQLGIPVTHTPTQSGRHHVWLAELGQHRIEGASFYQSDITAIVQKPLTRLRITLIIGVCLRIDMEKTDHGIKYVLNAPVQAAAAISLNQTNSILHQRRLSGYNKEFILDGPQQADVIQEFSEVICHGFVDSVEAALALVEG